MPRRKLKNNNGGLRNAVGVNCKYRTPHLVVPGPLVLRRKFQLRSTRWRDQAKARSLPCRRSVSNSLICRRWVPNGLFVAAITAGTRFARWAAHASAGRRHNFQTRDNRRATTFLMQMSNNRMLLNETVPFGSKPSPFYPLRADQGKGPQALPRSRSRRAAKANLVRSHQGHASAERDASRSWLSGKGHACAKLERDRQFARISPAGHAHLCGKVAQPDLMFWRIAGPRKTKLDIPQADASVRALYSPIIHDRPTQTIEALRIFLPSRVMGEGRVANPYGAGQITDMLGIAGNALILSNIDKQFSSQFPHLGAVPNYLVPSAIRRLRNHSAHWTSMFSD
jgi:hypothetical protein